MGAVVHLSGPATDLALYGDRSQFLQGYLYNQMQNLGPSLGQFGSRIQDAIATSYNFVTDQLTQLGLRRELEGVGLSIVDNYFQFIPDWYGLQDANPTMQRWIMSHPEVKRLYVNQDIDGYSDEYVDLDPGKVGEEDYNYRRVMNGVIQDVGEDWVCKQYHEDLLPGDKALTWFEQTEILNTWDTIDFLLRECKFDFTCKSEEPVERNG